MAISFSKAFGNFEPALQIRAERAQVLANNIANADTPGFQARDLDFQSMLKSRMGVAQGANLSMSQTQKGHQTGLIEAEAINGLQYRIPSAPSIDGNTVDIQKEKAEFARNTMEFQVAFQFLNSRVTGLSRAIKGE
jgi:flagellar basal-body rod protein FlgB